MRLLLIGNWIFGKIKVIFDWSLVAIAAVISLYYFGTIEGIREGTLVSAFATGMLVKFFMNMLLKIRIKRIGKLRQQCKINKNENSIIIITLYL